MKSILNRIAVVLVVGALSSVVALAKVHKHKVTFSSDIKINNTLVKKGTYDLKFDDETGQFTVSKSGKVVAQSIAKLEQRDKKASDFRLRSGGSGDDTQLLGVQFGGSDKEVVISNGGTQSTGNN
ncbi:MAG TPA: hypothetical protein VLA93_10045 [Pyrinomonadaceae bacterium]|nr:hypothetical protein [Pyrinomonadaceae bacterium]